MASSLFDMVNKKLVMGKMLCYVQSNLCYFVVATQNIGTSPDIFGQNCNFPTLLIYEIFIFTGFTSFHHTATANKQLC